MIPDAATSVGKLLRLPLRLVPRERPRRILSGRLRGSQWLPGSSVHSCWLGWYEQGHQTSLEGLLGEGDTFWDVGANVGFYSLLAARLVGPRGRVVAIEPVPRNLRYLHRHIGINALENVAVVEAAAGEREGTARFTESAGNAQNHFSDGGPLVVPVVTLDGLLATFPPPRALKIDIEGAEHLALEGARTLLQVHRPGILIAFHGDEARAECFRILSSFGYALHPVPPGDETSSEWIATPMSDGR
jgi:FkbM family methyltransferase